MNEKIRLAIVALSFLGCGHDEPAKVDQFTIEGSILERGQGVPGITLTIGGQTKAVTGGDGKYKIEGLIQGTYTVSPNQLGRSFNPAEKMVTIVDEDVDSTDFTLVANNQISHRGRIWEMFRSSVYSVKQNTTETLQLDLEQNALWFNNSQGGLVFMNVGGDFTLTARVNAVRKSNNNESVTCSICLGGIMVRDPVPVSGENYVHLVSGITPTGPGIEFKSTLNGVSTYNSIADMSTVHDLRIERVGDSFNLYQKLPTSSSWTLATTFQRAGFSKSPQVGVNIYTTQGGGVADLSVIFQNLEIK